MKKWNTRWFNKGGVMAAGLIVIIGVGEVVSYEKDQKLVDWEYPVTRSYRSDKQKTSVDSRPILYTSANTITLASGVGHQEQHYQARGALPRSQYADYDPDAYSRGNNQARIPHSSPLSSGDQIVRIDPGNSENVEFLIIHPKAGGKKVG